MSEKLTVEAVRSTSSFMTQKGWKEYVCAECARTFFSKHDSTTSGAKCGWYKCASGADTFRTFSKRKTFLRPIEISRRLSDYFETAGYTVASPRNVANSIQTDLIVAGVQVYDGIIHRNEALSTDKMFLAQPCVRMQFQHLVACSDGVSTSFVNVCTEEMGVGIDDHLQSVDHWCAALSKIGFHMNDITIILRTSVKNWGTGEFPAIELFYSYGGLELGDAAYFLVPQSNRPAIPISDIGFGLERLAWVINKTNAYFDTLMPWTVEGSREMCDACRTIALLVLCGVEASNKGPGLQLRRLCKILSEKYYGFDVPRVVAYYFDYWTQFIWATSGRVDAIQRAQLEIERFVNLRIAEILGAPPPRVETTEAYGERLVYTYHVDIDELRGAIHSCKK